MIVIVIAVATTATPPITPPMMAPRLLAFDGDLVELVAEAVGVVEVVEVGAVVRGQSGGE